MIPAKATLVILRNRTRAWVTGACEIKPFSLVGRRENGPMELWQDNGRWRADATEHPLDITHYVTPGGVAYALNSQSA